jgi:hypothetical protein
MVNSTKQYSSLPSRRDIRDGTAWTGLSAAWILLAALLITAICATLWWLGVFTAGTRGTAQVQLDQQKAGNREQWIATYNGEYQQLQADQSNLAVLKDAATGNGATQQDRINYTGAQLNCRTDVAKYNTDTQNLLGAPWLPAGLPTTVNTDTICGS